ncbi:MAG: efflux RND transporter periplasmic adaptor subunit [Alphaproteobacteria bacterium]
MTSRLFWRFVIWGVGLGVVFGGLAVFQLVVKPAMIKKFVGGAAAPVMTVSAIPAAMARWEAEIGAIGTLRAVNGVAIAPQVAGRITALMFESGEDVRADAVLAQLDDAVEQAQLRETLAMLRLADVELARGQELFRRGNFPKASLDRAEAERSQILAQTERIRAQIDQKKIRAPFAGRLGIRRVDLGQYLPAGAEMVTLQSVDPIYVDFSLPEQELPRLAVDQALSVTVDGFPGQRFAGRLTSIDSRVNQDTRNVLVRGTLANSGRQLVPGMFADLRVSLGTGADLIVVPQTAITFSLYGESVYVATREDSNAAAEPIYRVDRRFVRSGERRAADIAVVEGLKPGELIVTAGQVKLQNGSRIRIDPKNSLIPPAERPRP